MKKIVSIFVAMAVVFGIGLPPSEAAETKPIAALAVASYNDLVGDVNFVGSLIERPQLGAVMDGGVALVTQGKGLVGVDKTRPWGVIVQASGEDDFYRLCVRAGDRFQESLGTAGALQHGRVQRRVYKLTPKDGKKDSYVKQQGTWAFFAEKPEVLAQCDADPVAVLGNLEKNYIVAGRIFLANVPEGLRQKFLSQVKQGLQKEPPSMAMSRTKSMRTARSSSTRSSPM